jgi:hypothetical protein
VLWQLFQFLTFANIQEHQNSCQMDTVLSF